MQAALDDDINEVEMSKREQLQTREKVTEKVGKGRLLGDFSCVRDSYNFTV
jgi:hypothetical protein